MALHSYAFVTIADLRAVCSVPDGSQDDTLNRLANAVTDYLERRCGRQIKSRAVTEEFNGDGKTKHSLRHPPVAAAGITTIVVENAPAIDTSDADQVRYVNDGVNLSIVYLFQAAFISGIKNCAVTYPGGFETVPSDMIEACLQTVKLLYSWKNKNRELVRAITTGGETVHYHVNKAFVSLGYDDVVQRYELMRLQ